MVVEDSVGFAVLVHLRVDEHMVLGTMTSEVCCLADRDRSSFVSVTRTAVAQTQEAADTHLQVDTQMARTWAWLRAEPRIQDVLHSGATITRTALIPTR